MSPPSLRATAASIISAAAALAWPGCTVGPDYTAPDTPVPAEWTAGQSATAAPDPAWWSTLGDPALVSLVDQALAANLDLRIAEARVRRARAERGVAAAAGLPALDANGNYSRSRESENSRFGQLGGSNEPGGVDQYQAGLDASWEIDVFGGVRRAVEAATAEIQAAEDSRRDVLVMLVAEVARSYVDLRGAQRRIAVAQNNIRVQSDTLAISQSRFDAGLTSELDVAQGRAQLETTTASLPPLETQARQAIHRVSVLTGRPPQVLLESLLEPAPIPAGGSAIGDVPLGLPSDLLRRRPDIRRAERLIAAATARIGEATADLFPRFSLTGSFGLRSEEIGDLPEGDSRFWSIGPAVRWPIFQGGRIRSNIRVQEALTDEALAEYEQTVLEAFEDVENALVSLNREQARRASLSAAVEANRRAVELSDQLYRAGLADFQRVLDSQRNLFESEDSLAASDQAVVQALIRLYTALGGGWEIELVENAGVPQSPRPEGGG